jgi:hypothetical protein
LRVAERALAGDLPDMVPGCHFYYAIGRRQPDWAFGVEPYRVLGKHAFFRKTRRKDGSLG